MVIIAGFSLALNVFLLWLVLFMKRSLDEAVYAIEKITERMENRRRDARLR